MDFRILLVITPIIFSWIFTVFWLGRWDVFRLTPLGLPKRGVAPFKNYQVWEDSALIPDVGRPAEGYPVFTITFRNGFQDFTCYYPNNIFMDIYSLLVR